MILGFMFLSWLTLKYYLCESDLAFQKLPVPVLSTYLFSYRICSQGLSLQPPETEFVGSLQNQGVVLAPVTNSRMFSRVTTLQPLDASLTYFKNLLLIAFPGMSMLDPSSEKSGVKRCRTDNARWPQKIKKHGKFPSEHENSLSIHSTFALSDTRRQFQIFKKNCLQYFFRYCTQAIGHFEVE